jgi:hypothetical protein
MRVLPGRPAGGTRQGFLPGHLDRSNPLPPRSGREKFSERLAELGDVQHQFRRQRLQTTVLVLERLLPWSAGHFHPVVFRSPIVERRITDAVLTADLGKRITRLMLLQDRNDLFLRETALSSYPSPARRNFVQNEGAPRGRVIPGARSLDSGIFTPNPYSRALIRTTQELNACRFKGRANRLQILASTRRNIINLLEPLDCTHAHSGFLSESVAGPSQRGPSSSNLCPRDHLTLAKSGTIWAINGPSIADMSKDRYEMS